MPRKEKIPLATTGNFLEPTGRLFKPLKLKFQGHETLLKIRPIVVPGLSQDLILSYRFMRHYDIQVCPQQHAIRLQGKLLPFTVSGKGPDKATGLYTTKRETIPANSVAYVNVAPSDQTPAEVINALKTCCVVQGSPRILDSLECLPWQMAVSKVNEDGQLKVGIVNPNDRDVTVNPGILYGTASPSSKGGASFCVMDPEKPKGHSSRYDPSKDPRLQEKAENPKRDPTILEGPTTEKNVEARIQIIHEQLRFSKCDALETPAHRTAALKLILKHFHVFSWDGSYGSTDLIEHHIKLKPGTHPIRARHRTVNPRLEESLRAQLDDWLQHGVIEESQSEWNSSLVPVMKPSGSIRWCVDYRSVNNATEKDSHPIGSCEDNIGRLAGSKIYSVIDGQGAFHQIPMAEESKDVTSFSTPFGTYRFICMPFGLANAPSTYARLVRLALQGIPWSVALPFLDDTLIHSSNFEDHLKNLDEVLTAFAKSKLRLGPSKCSLFAKSVKYLGHLINKDGQQVLPSYAKTVQEWPLPNTRRKVRVFLGKCSYYRRFIPGFQKLAMPLTEKLSSKSEIMEKLGDNDPFEVDDRFIYSFESLKASLQSPPILAFPDFFSPHPFILDTDFSAETGTMGACLSQKQNGKERPLIYCSLKLTPGQRNMSATKGELYTAMTFIQRLKWYLTHQPFILRTDCSALLSMRKMDFPNGMEARWLATLANYEFKVIHRSGEKHGNADALSRVTHAVQDDDPEAQDVRALVGATGNPEMTVKVLEDAEKLLEEQKNDDDLAIIRQQLTNGGEVPTETIQTASKTAQLYLRFLPDLFIDDQQLLRWNKPSPTDYKGPKYDPRILVPNSMWTRVMQGFHEGCGHRGRAESVRRAEKLFYWPNMSKTARDIISACQLCQARGGPPKPQKGHYAPTVSGYPGQKLSIDIVGPLPLSGGYRYILTMICCFSKWLEAIAIRRATAETVCKVLTKEWLLRYGIPEQIHSDRGTTFTAEETQKMAKDLGIVWTKTPAYSPKSNLVERHHRTLGQLLVKLTQGQQHKWSEVLPQAVYIHRTMRSRTTNMSPYEALFGRYPNSKLDLLYRLPNEEIQKNPTKATLKEKIQMAHEIARKQLKFTIDRARASYTGTKIKFQPGQRVLLWVSQIPVGGSKKFGKRWTGPWTVVRAINPVIFEIAPYPAWLRKNNEIVTVDRLKSFRCSPSDDIDALSQPPPAEGELTEPGDEFAQNPEEPEEEEEEPPLPTLDQDRVVRAPAAERLPPPPPAELELQRPLSPTPVGTRPQRNYTSRSERLRQEAEDFVGTETLPRLRGRQLPRRYEEADPLDDANDLTEEDEDETLVNNEEDLNVTNEWETPEDTDSDTGEFMNINGRQSGEELWKEWVMAEKTSLKRELVNNSEPWPKRARIDLE